MYVTSIQYFENFKIYPQQYNKYIKIDNVNINKF